MSEATTKPRHTCNKAKPGYPLPFGRPDPTGQCQGCKDREAERAAGIPARTNGRVEALQRTADHDPGRVPLRTRLYARIFPTRARLDVHAKWISALDDTIESLSQTIDALSGTLDGHDRRIESCENAVDELIGEAGTLSERVERDTTNINTLARQLAELRTALEDARAQH